MKASEARARAMEVMNRDIECHKKMQEVYREIERAVNKGSLKVHITIPYRYHDFVSTQLIANGYRISIVFEKYEISW